MGEIVGAVQIPGLDEESRGLNYGNCSQKIALDRQGNFFFADRDRAQIFGKTGKHLSEISGFGYIEALHIDHQGHLWLAVKMDEDSGKSDVARWWQYGKVLKLEQSDRKP